jgi:hypothetical protein
VRQTVEGEIIMRIVLALGLALVLADAFVAFTSSGHVEDEASFYSTGFSKIAAR